MRSDKTDDAQVGIDGGYVRGRHKQEKFALIAGKSILAFKRDQEGKQEGGILAMTLVSFIHFDSAWYALLPPLAYVFCAMIEGNLATPLFLGRWLTLNPIAILLTFLLWSYLWGVTGTLLAVPADDFAQHILCLERALHFTDLFNSDSGGYENGDLATLCHLGLVPPPCSALSFEQAARSGCWRG